MPEIWLIDPEKREFHVDWIDQERKPAGGSSTPTPYRTELLREGRWSSRILPGFWIDVGWLWTDPLPKPLGCFQRIIQ